MAGEEIISVAGLCPLARQISHSDPLREMDEQPLFEGKCILEDNQNFKSIKNGVRKAFSGYIRFFWSLSILVCQELFSGIVVFQIASWRYLLKDI